MLTRLAIQNIAIVDNVTIDFSEGLNILTGETGAGKSIIIDSINAILGGRVNRDLIRSGESKAFVEAVFHADSERIRTMLTDLGIEPEEDGTVIVSREFNTSGRNQCRINGRAVTVSALKELGSLLIDVHGQHDNQSLLYPEVQLQFLDSFGGKDIVEIKKDYQQKLEVYRQLKSRIRDLRQDQREKERKLDLINFQINEIRKVKPLPGEDAQLEKERNILAHSEKIAASLSGAYDILYTGAEQQASALECIDQVKRELDSISKYNEEYGSLADTLENIYYQLEDVAAEIRTHRDEIQFDPARLEQIGDRLDQINRLKRKYAGTIEEILQYCDKLEAEREFLDTSEEKLQELHEKYVETENQLLALAAKLNDRRQKALKLLEERMESQLNDLEMKNARFHVFLEFLDRRNEDGEFPFNTWGLNKMEFQFSANPGEPLKPLARIASGGEMSRIMLAMKTILAEVDEIPTMIFDEIDTGISGKAARKVGEKMQYIAGKHQVICVTHLAQIASMADSHYLIRKEVEGNTTRTEVIRLSEQGVLEEIARILDGANISDISLAHAREMLDSSRRKGK